MKLLITGDLHITDKCPVHRIDDYQAAVFRKLEFSLKTARAKDAYCILQPGDFFDSFHVSDYVLQRTLELIEQNYHSRIFTIFGQHDLRYHNSNIENTPLKVLHSTQLADIVHRPLNSGFSEIPISSEADTCFTEIYGCSWFEEIPAINDPDAFNVLLIHRMIIDDKKLWEAQEEFTYGYQLLEKHGFDLIVSGDNHKHFVIQNGNKTLINCGSMMRKNIDQTDHKPVVYLFDTETREFEPIYIPIEPPEDVFEMEVVEKEKSINEEMRAFAEGLKNKDIKIISTDVVQNIIKHLKTSVENGQELLELFEELNGE
jgi:DNA repair exonuclease SbcCD nuclease subunit